MPPALLDRPVPRPALPQRRRSRLLPVVATALAVLLGALLVRGIGGWPTLPFGATEIDRSAPSLLTALADLEEYHAATGTFQVVVDLEKDVQWVPSVVSGERTTFLATGSVDAVVDLTGLDASAVTVDERRRSVLFSLPAARLDEADVDLENSRVLARDRGVLDRVGGMFSDSPTSERQVATLAEDKLDAAAAESDLRERAERNTRAMLTGLARSLGYTSVEVRFEAGDGV